MSLLSTQMERGFQKAMGVFSRYSKDKHRGLLERKRKELREISPIVTGRYMRGHRIGGNTVGNSVPYVWPVEKRYNVYGRVAANP